jgi:hypothetical protein
MIGPEVWHSVPPVSNWDALTVSVSGLYCDAMRRNMIAAADPLPVEDTRLVFRDAYAGTAQTVAFLQVVAEVAALRERRYPAAGLRRIAQRSKGFILHHAALNDAADSGLVYALAQPKPDTTADIETEAPFVGLRYNPKWFRMLRGDALGLDPQRVENLRGESNKHPNHGARPDDIWFGCPAGHIIPGLYDGLIALADAHGLLGVTYDRARGNLGYDR